MIAGTAAFIALNHKDRQLLFARFVDDEPTAVIAERLRKSTSSVERAMKRALNRMVSALGGPRPWYYTPAVPTEAETTFAVAG